jgi:hypothetical protein
MMWTQGGLLVVAEDTLRGMINWRNKAMETYMETYWRGSSAERRRLGNYSGPKRLLRQARKSLKNAVQEAKDEWIQAVLAEVNGIVTSSATSCGYATRIPRYGTLQEC